MPTLLGIAFLGTFLALLASALVSNAGWRRVLAFKEQAFVHGRVVLEGVVAVPASSLLFQPGSGRTRHAEYVVLPSGRVLLRGRSLFLGIPVQGAPAFVCAVLEPAGESFRYSGRVRYQFFVPHFCLSLVVILWGLGMLWQGAKLVRVVAVVVGFVGVVLLLSAVLLKLDVHRLKRALDEVREPSLSGRAPR